MFAYKGHKRHKIQKLRNRYIYITLLAVLGWNAETAAQNGARQVPRLVVNITIDQLRTDFLEAYAPLYSDYGFKRLLEKGKVYENATYPMVQPDRASAISSVITGTVPYYHSIVGERWLDKESLRPLYSTEDLKQNGLPSPIHLSVSTIGDELKVASHGEARIIAIAPFRDAAILSAGHAADGAFWLDDQTGIWTGSPYYPLGKDLPTYIPNEVRDLSKSIKKTTWIPFVQKATPDFKHTFNSNKKFREFQTSGLINTHVTEMAMQMVAQQNMGGDQVTDLLCLTYYAGPFNHQPVTDCQKEIEDTYLRLDRDLGNLITRLERSIGAGEVLFFITSTGYCDPEYSDYAKYHIPTGTFYVNRTANLLNMYFGAIWGQGRYIEACFDNQLFINHKLLEQRRINLTDFNTRARDFILQMEGVRNVYTSLQLMSESDGQISRIRNAYHPQRSGDILIEVSPGWHLQNEDTGEDRISQTSVMPFPVIIYGAGVQPARIQTSVTTDRIAPTIARAIRIRAPNACSSEPLF